MKSISLSAVVMAALFASGCGDEQNRSVVDLGDKEAIASYEEAIRDAERAMEASEANPAPEVTPND